MNQTIYSSLITAQSKLSNPRYAGRIMCSVSGGSDSDCVLELLSHCEGFKDVQYVWFDTGLEYSYEGKVDKRQ